MGGIGPSQSYYAGKIATIEPGSAKVLRNLDGKGRLILPGDFREAAGFAPDEPVAIELVSVGGRTGFLITAAYKPEVRQ